MFDILEYVKSSLITFDKKPLNEVDAMVFSWLTYYRLPKAMYKTNSFLKNVPSQLEAKKYLEKVVSKVKGNIYIAGHSKGGNLAVFAGGFIDDRKASRIKCIYNFDGPNLNRELSALIKGKLSYKRISKLVPQSSVVGMCFDNSSNYKIVRSNAIGVLQHSPFSWEVDKDKFKI